MIAHSAQIKASDSPNTDYDVYHLVIVPRHASASAQKQITQANAQVITNTNFLQHNICFKEKSTSSSADCPSPTLALAEDTA